MNLAELKDQGYKAFNRQSPTNKEGNITSLQYIESLASRCGINISSWNILELFGDPTARSDKHLLRDKNAINKIFFENEVKQRENVSEEHNKIRDMISKKADQTWKLKFQNQLNELRNTHEDYLRRAEQAARDQQKFVASAYEMYARLMKMEGKEETISVQVLRVLKDNFWGFLKIEADHIFFITKADIILTEINPAANINMRVNLGKFVCRFNLMNMTYSVQHASIYIPGSPGAFVDGFAHPHVTGGGSVCWGNVASRADQHQAKGELYEFMNLLASLLSSYSSSNPYRHLVSFQNARPQDQVPSGVVRETPQPQRAANIFDDPIAATPENITFTVSDGSNFRWLEADEEAEEAVAQVAEAPADEEDNDLDF